MATASKLRHPDRRDAKFREHEVVATSAVLEFGGVSIPAGTRCVIVHIHDSGAAYEVEFEAPPCVLMLRPGQLAAA